MVRKQSKEGRPLKKQPSKRELLTLVALLVNVIKVLLELLELMN